MLIKSIWTNLSHFLDSIQKNSKVQGPKGNLIMSHCKRCNYLWLTSFQESEPLTSDAHGCQRTVRSVLTGKKSQFHWNCNSFFSFSNSKWKFTFMNTFWLNLWQFFVHSSLIYNSFYPLFITIHSFLLFWLFFLLSFLFHYHSQLLPIFLFNLFTLNLSILSHHGTKEEIHSKTSSLLLVTLSSKKGH